MPQHIGFLFNIAFLIGHFSPPQNVENSNGIDFHKQTA